MPNSSDEWVRTSEYWHHVCVNEECATALQVSLENPGRGVRLPIPEPPDVATGPNCPNCGADWGPWVPTEIPNPPEVRNE